MRPEPSGAFAWVPGAPGPALVCRALEPFARHLFTTRGWPLGSVADGESAAAWRDVARAMGVDASQLSRVHQVHGAEAVVARPGDRPNADIVVSDDPNVAVAVQAADCVPLLLVDSRSGAVGAAHAGWRGLASRVPIVAVETLVRQFASRPDDLVVAAGPSIGACCYEVGADVRAAFERAGFRSEELARWFFDEPQPSVRNPSMRGRVTTRREGHSYFDGWTATRDQLLSAGVRNDRIHIAELCTASHPGELCSYRRDGKGAGRMAAAIRRITRS